MSQLHLAAQRLQARLGSLEAPGVRPAVHLQRAVEKIRIRFGGGHTGLVTQDRVRDSVKRLLTGGPASLKRSHRFILAHALAQSVPELGDRSVMDSSRLATSLISEWESEAGRGELRPSHWRGLFHSYMQSGISDASIALRDLLRRALPGLSARFRRAVPPWFEVMQRHSGLLGASACAPYIEELLAGGRDRLTDLVSELRPSESSWFWVELAGALVRAIDRLDDMAFQSKIEIALSLTRDARTLRDEILRAVLDRQARTQERSRHEVLLAFALDAWSSPQLARNALWNLVRPDTRQMVCGWLAQEDLEDFYRLCQGERRVDERRLKYWLRFRRQIGFSQIILGQSLYWSRDPDAADFRERKKGRLAQLRGGGTHNNAIVMQIAGHIFIEFSETGNACYAYRTDGTEFQTGEAAYLISELRLRDEAVRLLHKGEWERERFDPDLARMNIYPDGEDRPRTGARTTAAKMSSARGRGGGTSGGMPGEAERQLAPGLQTTVLKWGARVVDQRARGGYLWVEADRYVEELDRQLRAAGFGFKAGRGYYLQ